jgi:aryl-alcohol dehydrogenase-like predicted oxidoreductase
MGYDPRARRRLGSAPLEVTQLGLGCGPLGGFRVAHPAVSALLPGAISRAEVLDNAEHLRTDVPSDLWAELKHEGLLHAAAPVPAPSRA